MKQETVKYSDHLNRKMALVKIALIILAGIMFEGKLFGYLFERNWF